MVWDLRPRLPTVRTISTLPMAGLAYAVGSKSSFGNTVETCCSPPPEYNIQPKGESKTRSKGPISVDNDGESTTVRVDEAIDATQLQRALTFQQEKSEALDRGRYIIQGQILLNTSIEGQGSATTSEELLFSRDLYLTGLEYLVRGVPTNLSSSEQLILSRTIESLSKHLDPDVYPHRDSRRQDDDDGVPRAQVMFVALCRGTATLIKVSIPHLKASLQSAIDFENQHHVLERSGTLVSNSLYSFADGAARTRIPVPNLARFSGLCTTLTIGLSEAYKILSTDT